MCYSQIISIQFRCDTVVCRQLRMCCNCSTAKSTKHSRKKTATLVAVVYDDIVVLLVLAGY